MNWVKANKFLTGFIVVMLIGIGALGYEVYTASSAYDDAAEGYTKASGEYNRLRHLVPYPNKQNLEEYQKQKEVAAKRITAFEADLAKKEFPFEQLSPEGFQDKLKASLTAVRKKAEEAGIKLPEKGFYLGFERYEASPPPPQAAAPLGHELKAIEWVLNQYLSQPASNMDRIVSLTRADLPEETGSSRGPRGGSGGGNRGSGFGGGGGSSRGGLTKHHPFDISVICRPAGMMAALKSITGTQAPQFFILRQIRIKNEHEKAPPKAVDPAKADKEKGTTDYLVGREWIEVTARWEMVDFVDPSDKGAVERAASEQPGSAPQSTPGSRPGPGPRPAPAPRSTPAPQQP